MRAELLNAADVAFLCLPDAAARDAVALVRNPKTCLIDASTAHRTDPAWVFGLPELAPGQREKIRASKRIANPGCHALSFIVLLRPLVDAGLVKRDAAISATSISGYSGGGKKMIEQYEAANDPKLGSPRPYSLNFAHKHLPEMTAHTGLHSPPIFMPVVANYYKGLAVSVPLHMSQLDTGLTGEVLHRTYEQRYRGEPFIRLQPMPSDMLQLLKNYSRNLNLKTALTVGVRVALFSLCETRIINLCTFSHTVCVFNRSSAIPTLASHLSSIR